MEIGKSHQRGILELELFLKIQES